MRPIECRRFDWPLLIHRTNSRDRSAAAEFVGVVVSLPHRRVGGGCSKKESRAVIAQDNHNMSHLSTEIEVTRLAVQVHGGVRQTRLVSQAITRMAAEVRCLAGEADALVVEIGAFARECGEESSLETPRGE